MNVSDLWTKKYYFKVMNNTQLKDIAHYVKK